MSNSEILQSGWIARRHPIVYYVFATILIVAFLKLGSDLLIPLVFASLITLTLSPAIDRLEQYRLPSWLSVVVVLVGMTATALLGTWYLAGQVTTLIAESQGYGSHFTDKIDGILQAVSTVLERLGLGRGIASWQRLRTWWRGEGNEQLLTLSLNLLYGLRVPLGHFLLVYLLTFFLLIDRKKVRDRIYTLLGRRRLFSATISIAESTEKIQRYLFTQTVINMGCAVTAGLICHIHGVPQPYLWGFLVGLMRYVPVIGFWIACSAPIALCFVVHDGWVLTFSLLAAFVLLEVLLAYIIEPLFVGKSVGLSTLGVICAAIFWGWVWGVPGVILAVPLTITLSTLSISVPQLQFLPTLVGVDVDQDARLRFLHRFLAGDEKSIRDQLRESFESQSPTEALTNVILPGLAEVHRIAISPSDKINSFIKRSISAVSAELEALRKEGVQLPDLRAADILVLAADQHDSGLFSAGLSSFFTALGGKNREASIVGLVSDIVTLCRKDVTAPPVLLLPVLTDVDDLLTYRFLKRFMKVDPLPAVIVVLLDPAMPQISEGLSSLLADERIRVVQKWERLIDLLHEIAVGNRIAKEREIGALATP